MSHTGKQNVNIRLDERTFNENLKSLPLYPPVCIRTMCVRHVSSIMAMYIIVKHCSVCDFHDDIFIVTTFFKLICPLKKISKLVV